MYEAQRQAFRDEHKGIRLTDFIVERFLNQKSPPNSHADSHNDSIYPVLGSNTTATDYREAQFMQSLPASTKSDIVAYRRKIGRNIPSTVPPESTQAQDDVALATTETIQSTPLRGELHLTPNAKKLHKQLACSNETTPTGRKVGQARTRDNQRAYSQLDRCFGEAKGNLLKSLSQVTTHHALDASDLDRFTNASKEIIDEMSGKIQEEINKLREKVPTNEVDDETATDIKFSGEENPQYASPALGRRFRGGV